MQKAKYVRWEMRRLWIWWFFMTVGTVLAERKKQNLGCKVLQTLGGEEIEAIASATFSKGLILRERV